MEEQEEVLPERGEEAFSSASQDTFREKTRARILECRQHLAGDQRQEYKNPNGRLELIRADIAQSRPMGFADKRA